MWRRASTKLSALRSVARTNRTVAFTPSPVTIRPAASIVNRFYSGNVSKKVEDVMPIATGHEREKLEAELQGRDILDINYPKGPFGTKEAPAVVKSYYDQRIVDCPGGEGKASGGKQGEKSDRARKSKKGTQKKHVLDGDFNEEEDDDDDEKFVKLNQRHGGGGGGGAPSLLAGNPEMIFIISQPPLFFIISLILFYFF